jgi:hypothetical protein
MSRRWNVALLLAALYLIAGAICFAVTHTPVAFLYPALWAAIVLAVFSAIAAIGLAGVSLIHVDWFVRDAA